MSEQRQPSEVATQGDPCPDCQGYEGCHAAAWAWDEQAGITEESPCTLCAGTGYLPVGHRDTRPDHRGVGPCDWCRCDRCQLGFRGCEAASHSLVTES